MAFHLLLTIPHHAAAHRDDGGPPAPASLGSVGVWQRDRTAKHLQPLAPGLIIRGRL